MAMTMWLTAKAAEEAGTIILLGRVQWVGTVAYLPDLA